MSGPRRILQHAIAAALLTCTGLAIAQPGEVETVSPDAFEALATGQKGVLVVSLSSIDPRCGYCVRHNAKFKAMAHDRPDVGRFVQVLWQPWTEIPPPVAAFLKAHGKMPAVPAEAIFQDGKLDRITMGEMAAPAPATPAPETGHVPQIAPQRAADTLAQSRGLTVVMLSSFETGCAFCMRANPAFETLAEAHPDVHFARVMYRPWTAAFLEPFGKTLGVQGLPVYLAYQDGRLVRRVDGHWDLDVLSAKLIDAK